MLKHLVLAPGVSTFLVASAVALSARAQSTTTAPGPVPAPTAPSPTTTAAPPAEAPPPATTAEPAPPNADVSAAAPAPAVTPATPPAGELSATDSQALAALEAEAADTAAAAGPSFQLYGFADFSARFLTNDGIGYDTIGAHSGTLAVGNLNLYGAADLTGGWRSLFEVRFLYVPNGILDFTTFERSTTAAGDPADDGRPLFWGGIQIERAYLEYTAHSLLTLRVGQFLTPYGIWNVDHGSPTIITVNKPYPIGEHLFPDRQTGLEVFGSAPLGDTSLGYHLTLSNGRGTSATYQDLDSNKALGGRLFFTSHPAGTLTLGVSGYYGRSTESGATLAGTTFAQDVTVQFDELSYAADLLWQWEGLHVQGEIMANEVVFTDEGRPAPAFVAPGTPAGLIPDHRRLGGYGLAGYRLPWLTLMPFVLGEYVHQGTKVTTGFIGGGAGALSFGLNARPVPTVALKGQFRHIFFKNDGPAVYLDDVLLSAAWSF